MPSVADAPAGNERVGALASIFSDPVAFRHWYEAAVVRVYAYLCGRCGGDASLAEELTQQTFIQAIERRDTYEGRSSDMTWLLAIARNKLTDHWRRVDREERRHLRLVVREIAITGDTARTSFEDREAVLTALRSLPALQRAAVVLCYVDGLSVREAAGMLGRSESATESLLSRARQRLRATLETPDG